jgi:RNA polymerase-binding transcription factor DksA
MNFLEGKMSENFVLSRRVMQLLEERLQEDLWYSQERRDVFAEDCVEHKAYQNAIDEDKKLIEELNKVLNEISIGYYRCEKCGILLTLGSGWQPHSCK